jgi:hypothetical protein
MLCLDLKIRRSVPSSKRSNHQYTFSSVDPTLLCGIGENVIYEMGRNEKEALFFYTQTRLTCVGVDGRLC